MFFSDDVRSGPVRTCPSPVPDDTSAGVLEVPGGSEGKCGSSTVGDGSGGGCVGLPDKDRGEGRRNPSADRTLSAHREYLLHPAVTPRVVDVVGVAKPRRTSSLPTAKVKKWRETT